MQDKAKILKAILDSRIVAIIRLDESDPIYELATTLYSAGIKAIEVTIGTPNVFEEIRKLSAHPDIIAGVGSVINISQAEEAIDAGAEFVVTPVTKKEIIQYCNERSKPIFSGAYSPSEIEQAYDWGADVVKLFPAGIGGLPYFKAVSAPMPFISIMPTGGVSIKNAKQWLDAGAVCLGVGGGLVNKELVKLRNFDQLKSNALELVSSIR